MPRPGSVGIFWDYENCSITPAKNHAATNKILDLAHTFGTVVAFNAYSEWSKQKSTKVHDLRLILPSCGVSLVDCPHNGKKDVADKVLLTDMKAFVSDNRPPATIVLISGDGDFTNAVKELRRRSYNVVLFAPTATAPKLRAEASTVFKWPPSNKSRVSTSSKKRTKTADSRISVLERRSHIPTKKRIKTKTVPDKFKPLVAVLQRQRIEGVTRVLFSELGTLLSQEKTPPSTIYKKAGATKLKGYIAAAESHRVVSMRKVSKSGGATISLHPRFCTSPGSRP